MVIRIRVRFAPFADIGTGPERGHSFAFAAACQMRPITSIKRCLDGELVGKADLEHRISVTA